MFAVIVVAALLLTQTFADLGAAAARTLTTSMYAGGGLWRECETGCTTSNRDWGVDSLTYVLWLRWHTSHDALLVPIARALIGTAPLYGGCIRAECPWSDVPEWDSIAASHLYVMTNDRAALMKAEGDYRYVAQSTAFALGACPEIRFQLPDGARGGLKTLESDANAIKAALLLFDETKDPRYLSDATRTYAAVRAHFLDAQLPLYSVYVFDDGKTCRQVPRRFFASVNGDMIYSGLYLYRYTNQHHYLDEALATARAVETRLADPSGVFADLQAENDIVEPLVEAMYDLALLQHDAGAKTWLLNNAAAGLLQDRDAHGWYGRFFNGPKPAWNLTVWQSNGGLALAVAAAALEPGGVPSTGDWSNAHFVSDVIDSLPSPPVHFKGRAIAIIGTIGDNCCEPGHATVSVDGIPIVNHTGIWQNKSSAGIGIPHAVLFAWQWSSSGEHFVQFGPGEYNAKEGGPYLHIEGYYVVP